MSLTHYPNGITSQGVPLFGGAQPDISGDVYFADENFGSAGNDGRSWEFPFATLAAAFAASHASIAAGGNRTARRNTIYISGDFEEDLIVFPQHTDVIGVGSKLGFKGATILGNHAPVNAGIGCRFFNVGFEPVTAAVIMTLTAACYGTEFHGCEFRANGTLIATAAIDTTASPYLKVIECDFFGAFTGDIIDIGAGDVSGMIIQGNRLIGGADNGIVFTGTGTIASGRMALIADNYIQVADIIIDTNATSVAIVINNVGVSGEALGASSYVIDLTFAAGNLLTGADTSVTVPSYTTVA